MKATKPDSDHTVLLISLDEVSDSFRAHCELVAPVAAFTSVTVLPAALLTPIRPFEASTIKLAVPTNPMQEFS